MEQKGIVVKADAEKAQIRIVRKSMCGGNCASCKGCPAEVMLITVDNTEALNAGDEVVLKSETKGIVRSAFIGYVGLSIFLIVGAVFGYKFGGSEIMSVLGGGAGLLLGLLFLRLAYSKKEPKYEVEKLQ